MTRRRKTNPVRRRRRNPSSIARVNPGGGIGGMVMGGVWVGAGMYLGGIINGFIPQFGGGGMLMELARGVGTAWVVRMIGSKFTGNAGLMAAGAFAPTALSLISHAVSSVSGGFGGILGGSKAPVAATPQQQIPTAAPVIAAAPSGVLQFPSQQQQG